MRRNPAGRTWFVGFLAVLGFALTGTAAERPSPEFPLLRPISASDSVLVVSPHPDDESLCCGGLIHAARRAGAQVSVVWVTNGDAFKWDAMVVEKKLRPHSGAYHALANQRIGEARKAATILDVPDDSQLFLAYPDRGILSLVLDHYYYATAWRSKYTGDDAVVFAGAITPGAVFDGEDLERDFISVLDRVKPTLVLAPSPQDTHPDHRAVGILAHRVTHARLPSADLRFWLVHGGRGWPSPRGFKPQLPQTVAPRGRGMEWEQFPLDAEAVDTKRNAVEAHLSQTKVMNHVMLSHIRSMELYSRTPVPSPDTSCLSADPCEFEDAPVSEEAAL